MSKYGNVVALRLLSISLRGQGWLISLKIADISHPYPYAH